jgi:nucleoside 2-deoxyribosyltransferase
MTTVYLAGPINGCSDSEMNDWRDDMAKRLRDFTILSPAVRDYRGKEDESVEEIVEGDKKDIDASDIVIAYCPKPSVGTSMEILYAWMAYKHVIIYAPEGAPISPWLRYHSNDIRHTAADVAVAVVLHEAAA